MFYANILIKILDIIKALNNLQNKIQKQILTALIYKAIVKVYLGFNILLSKNPQFKHLYMPIINVIPIAQISSFNLGLIITKKAFISNTYKVLNNIFLY